MGLQQILCCFLAPVPVNHRVVLEYQERDIGNFGRTMEVDRRYFIVTDLETGIRWGSSITWSHDPPFQPDPKRIPKERYEGVVRKSEVSSHMGPGSDEIWTLLVVDVLSGSNLY